MIECRVSKKVLDRVLGDSLRLGQVLINLAGNALKFTHRGKISLSATLLKTERENVTVHFAVRDTGIGINQHQAQQLFKAFSQADTSTTRKFGGTGLGLSISQSMVNLMGGEISLTSTPGRGSEFSFDVVFEIAKALPAPSSVKMVSGTAGSATVGNTASNAPTASLWEGKRVLLVEDNQVNQLLAKTILKKANISVDVAINGQEAIHALVREEFDLVLMDIQMPIMDGYEATRCIREILQKPELPVIAMTANAMQGDKERCLEAGMDDFLTKPINQQQLITTIGHWVSQTEVRQKPAA